MKSSITKKITCSVTLTFLMFNVGVYAANQSPVGYWKVICDHTNKAVGVVKIWKHHNKLFGKVVQIYGSRKRQLERCNNCPGQYRNKPVLCLPIMWNMVKVGNNVWSKGISLSPKFGAIYASSLILTHQGKKLRIKASNQQRNENRQQTWIRLNNYHQRFCK